MAGNRIIYQNWIVDIGRDPSAADPQAEPVCSQRGQAIAPSATGQAPEAESRQTTIAAVVGRAVAELSAAEQELVRRLYFMGEGYTDLSEKTGKAIHKLEAMHKRVLRKLRRKLGPFVEREFGIRVSPPPPCPICRSTERAEIDLILGRRPREETWRPVLKLLASRFGIAVTTPQIVIGHVKYHM